MIMNDLNGILIIDKPADWTSFDVVKKLRGALRVKRVGHGGTLDPMATGVLPVFVGRATKMASYSENADKEYIAGIRFGLTTDTQDITGTVLSSCEGNVTAEELQGVIPQFLFAQKQIPPMYSAIKIGGRKLYELARKGIEVERPPRDVYIYKLELLSFTNADSIVKTDDEPNEMGRHRKGGATERSECLLSGRRSEAQFVTTCSKGTYIRTLCHDIGAAIGCGAVMSSLRRTSVGDYTIEKAHSLDVVLDAVERNEIERYFVC